MFINLFFITPLVLLILTITFSLCIHKIDKIPEWLTVDLGKLNANDIRKLEKKKREHLRNHVIIRFTASVIATLAISLVFIVLGDSNNGLLAIPCNLISLIVGLTIALSVIKEANRVKQELTLSK